MHSGVTDFTGGHKLHACKLLTASIYRLVRCLYNRLFAIKSINELQSRVVLLCMS